MRFIRVKVKTLQILDSELLNMMIDDGFDLKIEIPLPDIYQRKISN